MVSGGGIAPRRARDPKPVKPLLAPEASAELTDRLLAELNNLGSADDAATWARRSLGDKNRLIAPDAQRVEEASRESLARLWSSSCGQPSDGTRAHGSGTAQPRERNEAKRRTRRGTKLIDKSLLTLPEPRRIRDREHVKSVAKHPCLIYGGRPSDATICDLPKPARSAVRSAMSSPSPCVEDTIARSTAAATKRLGGRAPDLIRSSRPGRFGLRRVGASTALPSKLRETLGISQ